jgi:hypothetical protein
MMVPLTESLYVEGYVHDKDKILVEIGTGYFAEVRKETYMSSKVVLASLGVLMLPACAEIL